jgi:threonine synthase
VLNALKLACSEEIKFDLSDYKVEVRGQGADAVVNVDLTLKKDGVQSVGTGTSPDIIQASIEAFAEAYNAFLARGMK